MQRLDELAGNWVARSNPSIYRILILGISLRQLVPKRYRGLFYSQSTCSSSGNFFLLLTTLALSGEERIHLFGNIMHIGLRRDKDIAADLDRVIDFIYAAPDVFTIRISKPSVDYTSLPVRNLAELVSELQVDSGK